MKQGAWRTGPPHKHPSPVTSPSAGQLIRQGLILLVLLAIWGGALALFINATAASDRTVANAAAPILIPIVAPSPTATALPATATTASATSTRPAATATAIATSTPTALPTDPPTPIEPSAAPTQTRSAQVSFARDVQPIFDRVCVKCHGGEETKEGLVLKNYAELMAGSNNGPVIAPGDPANSLLIDLITKGKMPKKGPRLLPGEVRAITDWVAAGAANN